MKKILLLLFLVVTGLSVQAQNIYNPNIFTATNKSLGLLKGPTDARSYYYDPATFSGRPYQDTAEVLSYLPSYARTGNFPIFVKNEGDSVDTWMFRDGTEDSDLVMVYKGTGGIDLSVLNQYMKYTDTASISHRIDAKLAISDTSSLARKDGVYPDLTSGDAQKLNGKPPSWYLDYNNLANKPSNISQVNADWDAESGVARILNKPAIPDSTLIYNKIDTKLDIGDTTVFARKTALFSGKYEDLLDKPIIVYDKMTQAEGIAGVDTARKLIDASTLKAIVEATSTGDMRKSVYDPTGIEKDAFDYRNFTHTPDIPSGNDQLTNVKGYITSVVPGVGIDYDSSSRNIKVRISTVPNNALTTDGGGGLYVPPPVNGSDTTVKGVIYDPRIDDTIRLTTNTLDTIKASLHLATAIDSGIWIPTQNKLKLYRFNGDSLTFSILGGAVTSVNSKTGNVQLNLSLNGRTLSLTGGNSVALPADQWIADSSNYYDKDAINALQAQATQTLTDLITSNLNNYYNKTQSDGRYLQSYTETDPVALAKTITVNGITKALSTNPSFTISTEGSGSDSAVVAKWGLTKTVNGNVIGLGADSTKVATLAALNDSLRSKVVIDTSTEAASLHDIKGSSTIHVSNGENTVLNNDVSLSLSPNLIAVDTTQESAALHDIKGDGNIQVSNGTNTVLNNDVNLSLADNLVVVDTTQAGASLHDIKQGYGTTITGGTNTVIGQDVTVKVDTASANGVVSKSRLNNALANVGTGSGDMLKSVYDPANGGRQVAFSDQLFTSSDETDPLWEDDKINYLKNRNTDNNWDSVLVSGRSQFVLGNNDDAPYSGYMHGLFISHGGNTDYGTELAFRDNRFYLRSIDAGVIQPWETIAYRDWVDNNYPALSDFNTITTDGNIQTSGSGKVLGQLNLHLKNGLVIVDTTAMNDSVSIGGGSGGISEEVDPTVTAYTKTLTSNTAVLNAVKNVDGAGSGLNADLLDGQDGSYYSKNIYTSDGSVDEDRNITFNTGLIKFENFGGMRFTNRGVYSMYQRGEYDLYFFSADETSPYTNFYNAGSSVYFSQADSLTKPETNRFFIREDGAIGLNPTLYPEESDWVVGVGSSGLITDATPLVKSLISDSIDSKTITINGVTKSLGANPSFTVSGGEGGSGTVTSVGLSLPSSVFSLSGSPVTSSGTLTGSFKSQTANTVFAAPSGSNGVPTFRDLVSADIPNLSTGKITSGIFSTARLGSGTASSSTYLRGDGTWASLPASNGEANVQSDWNESNTSSDAYIKNKPTLFSGSYNDLTNKPTIPTVNNATLTLNTSGIASGSTTFTANSSSNRTFTVNVPSTLSSYTNDAGFVKINDGASTSTSTYSSSKINSLINASDNLGNSNLTQNSSTRNYNINGGSLNIIDNDASVTGIATFNAEHSILNSATSDGVYGTGINLISTSGVDNKVSIAASDPGTSNSFDVSQSNFKFTSNSSAIVTINKNGTINLSAYKDVNNNKVLSTDASGNLQLVDQATGGEVNVDSIQHIYVSPSIKTAWSGKQAYLYVSEDGKHIYADTLPYIQRAFTNIHKAVNSSSSAITYINESSLQIMAQYKGVDSVSMHISNYGSADLTVRYSEINSDGEGNVVDLTDSNLHNFNFNNGWNVKSSAKSFATEWIMRVINDSDGELLFVFKVGLFVDNGKADLYYIRVF